MLTLRRLIGFICVCSLLTTGVIGDELRSTLDDQPSLADVDSFRAEITDSSAILSSGREHESGILESESIVSENLEVFDDKHPTLEVPSTGVARTTVIGDDLMVEASSLQLNCNQMATQIEQTRIVVENLKMRLHASPTQDELTEKEEAFQSVAAEYQQLTKKVEVTQAELEDARNRLIAYLEADLVKVAEDAFREESNQKLKIMYDDALKTIEMLRSEVNSLALQVQETPLVQTSSDLDAEQKKEEFKNLQVANKELTNENNALKTDIEGIRLQHSALSDDIKKYLNELEARNQDLASELSVSKTETNRLTEASAVIVTDITDHDTISVTAALTSVKEELSRCLVSLNEAEEDTKTCSTNLKISKNAILIEKLTSENVKMELELLSKESKSRIKSFSKDVERYERQLQSKRSVQSRAGPVNGSTGEGNLIKNCEIFLIDSYYFISERATLIVSSVWTAVTGTIAFLSDAVHPYIPADIVTAASSVQTGLLADIPMIYSKMSAFLESVHVAVSPLCSHAVHLLSDAATALSSALMSVAHQCVTFYLDTLFPVFHHIIFPEIRKTWSKVARLVSSIGMQVLDLYSTTIQPPVWAFYQSYMKAHVDAVAEAVSSAYSSSSIKGLVDLHVAPTMQHVCSSVIQFLSGLGASITAFCRRFSPIRMTDLGSKSLDSFLSYRRALLTYLSLNPTVQSLLGGHTLWVTTTIVNFLVAYFLYALTQMCLAFLRYMVAGPLKRQKTHGVERASIRIVRKGSSDLSIDCKDESDKEAYRNTLSRQSTPQKNIPTAPRSAPPTPKSPKATHMPYSGIPLNSTS